MAATVAWLGLAFCLQHLLVIQAGNTYMLSKLVNVGLSAGFSVSNMSQCADYCSDRVSAVSYSKYWNQCVTSLCGTLQLVLHAMWDTFICGNPISLCSLPSPMLEWTMTDTCGINNTGWLLPGLPMIPRNNPWLPMLELQYIQSLSGYMGNSIYYTGTAQTMAVTPLNSINLTLSSNSLTVFTWFLMINTTNNRLLFLEFGNWYDNPVNYTYGPHFWVDFGGIYFNFRNAGCSGKCIGMVYPYNMTLNVWTNVAMVFDKVAKTVVFYLNGSLVFTGNTSFSSSVKINSVQTIGRTPNYGFSGTTYCLKVYQLALTNDEINAVAKSCINGTLTF